jgi:hypothetical protein
VDWSCCCVRQQLHRLCDRVAHVAVWLYREFTPAESNRSVRLAETYVTSLLALDRSEKQPTPEAVESELGDEPAD